MIRTFKQHEIRNEEELTGFWRVHLLNGVPESVKKNYLIPVPGVLQEVPTLGRFRGKAEYIKEITAEEDGNYLLTFYGVSFYAEVYVDEVLIGTHYNAFTRFDLTVELKKGVHTLKVRVSNEFDENSALHVINDYESYLGITRPVSIARVPASYIDWMHVTPVREENMWKLRIEIKITGTEPGKLTVTILGKQQEMEVAADGHAVCSFTFVDEEVNTWSPEAPILYYAAAVLETESGKDDLTERFGFRTVEVSGSEILLNGRPIRLKGFCRHEDFGNIGCAIGPSQMMEDLLLMMELNCNSVRTSHYPNDVRFLDFCDEIGLLVWEENHARGLSLEQMQHPNFNIQCSECNQKMVTYDFNHPSIYVWGILNECASETEYGYSCYKKQLDEIKALDPSRPVTFASCKNFEDRCFGLVDIVSMNVYPGWYHDTTPGKWVDDLKAWIDKTEGAGKPFIVSEFGAGAIYGFHDIAKAKWSEERQAEILESQLKDFLARSYVNGTYIWQFADCKVVEDTFYGRPKAENNKGVFDRYRRPKMSYEVVRKAFEEN